jgi:hypothetical protein
MDYYFYSTKENTLYINSDLISPNIMGMTIKERYKVIKETSKISYPERIKKFCKNQEALKVINEQLEIHKGCTISEFTNVML